MNRGLGPRDIGLLLLICLCWAINFLTSAHALQELPPFLFTAVRMAILVAQLVWWLRRPPPGQWPRLLTVAMLVGVLHFGSSFLALHLAGNLSSPAIVMQSYVPMAALLAWWMLGERFAWRTGLAIAISFAGVLVLGFDPLVLRSPLALMVMLVSAALLALGTVLMRRLRGFDMVNQQGWIAVLSVLPLFAISLMFEPDPLGALREASWIGWGGAVYAAVFGSLLGHGLFFVLVQRHPVADVTPYLLFTPVLAVALGIVFWGDRPGPAMWVGGAMVLGGVLTIALRTRRKARTPLNDTAPGACVAAGVEPGAGRGGVDEPSRGGR